MRLNKKRKMNTKLNNCYTENDKEVEEEANFQKERREEVEDETGFKKTLRWNVSEEQEEQEDKKECIWRKYLGRKKKEE